MQSSMPFKILLMDDLYFPQSYSDSRILLTVQDNGPGLPKGFQNNLWNSMGMELLQGLTDDVRGSLSIENSNGTCIKILFKHKETTRHDISVS